MKRNTAELIAEFTQKAGFFSAALFRLGEMDPKKIVALYEEMGCEGISMSIPELLDRYPSVWSRNPSTLYTAQRKILRERQGVGRGIAVLTTPLQGRKPWVGLFSGKLDPTEMYRIQEWVSVRFMGGEPEQAARPVEESWDDCTSASAAREEPLDLEGHLLAVKQAMAALGFRGTLTLTID